MIFTTDSSGRATFVSREWEELTGQTLAEVIDFGWTDAVHVEDRAISRGVVLDAIRERSAFSVRYRLICRDGRCLWVAAGAVPSFGPPGRSFLGFLGSITPIAEAQTGGLKAYGSIGPLHPPPAHQSDAPTSALELAADHLLILHALLAGTDHDPIRSTVEAALRQVGVALAKVEKGDADPTKFH